jgi:hypothetical protein
MEAEGGEEEGVWGQAGEGGEEGQAGPSPSDEEDAAEAEALRLGVLQRCRDQQAAIEARGGRGQHAERGADAHGAYVLWRTRRASLREGVALTSRALGALLPAHFPDGPLSVTCRLRAELNGALLEPAEWVCCRGNEGCGGWGWGKGRGGKGGPGSSPGRKTT